MHDSAGQRQAFLLIVFLGDVSDHLIFVQRSVLSYLQ